MVMKEFVIWGVPPNKTDEELIYTKATSKEDAETVMKIFTEQYGLTKARIQVLDLNECPSKLWKSKKLINV
tara:strand:- start:9794 stop:10006 length:213 start_codon:yes stop_codon:yes gene_type:complete